MPPDVFQADKFIDFLQAGVVRRSEVETGNRIHGQLLVIDFGDEKLGQRCPIIMKWMFLQGVGGEGVVLPNITFCSDALEAFWKKINPKATTKWQEAMEREHEELQMRLLERLYPEKKIEKIRIIDDWESYRDVEEAVKELKDKKSQLVMFPAHNKDLRMPVGQVSGVAVWRVE